MRKRKKKKKKRDQYNQIVEKVYVEEEEEENENALSVKMRSRHNLGSRSLVFLYVYSAASTDDAVTYVYLCIYYINKKEIYKNSKFNMNTFKFIRIHVNICRPLAWAISFRVIEVFGTLYCYN